MEEPDLVFLDFPTFAFYSLCVLFFLCGVAAVDQFAPAAVRPDSRRVPKGSKAAFLLFPLGVATAFCVASSILLLRDYPGLLIMLESQTGSVVKDSDIGLHAPLGLSATWLLGILWWASWRYRQWELPPFQRTLVRLSIFGAGLAFFISASLRLSRGELMPLVCSMGLLSVLWRVAQGRFTPRFCITLTTILLICVCTIFLLFSVVRGGEFEIFGENLSAYTIAGYNRLAALIHGKLHYPYAGHGVYILDFVVFNNMLNRVIPLREMFHWPAFFDVWQSEFGATWAAGLNGYSIFSGAFGYMFAEIGWFAPLLVFIYGLLYGWVWRLFKSGSTVGIVLYPWLAFCILFWFGTNYLFDNKGFVLFLLAGLLTCYERVGARRRPELC